MPSILCNWTIGADPDGREAWTTSCGMAFRTIDGTPGQNKLVFCGFCGRVLREVVAPCAAPMCPALATRGAWCPVHAGAAIEGGFRGGAAETPDRVGGGTDGDRAQAGGLGAVGKVA